MEDYLSRKLGVEHAKRYRAEVFKDLQGAFFFWLAKSLHNASRKNVRLMWQIGLILKRYGLSNTGSRLLTDFGQFIGVSTFYDMLRAERKLYLSVIKKTGKKGFWVWLDNFAKFLKHFLLDKLNGSATSNQMTAVAIHRLPPEVILLAGHLNSWPTSPCSLGARNSIKAKLLSAFEFLKSSNFSLIDEALLIKTREILSIPLKLSVPNIEAKGQ